MNTSRIDTLQELLLKEPNDSFLNYALALEYLKTQNHAEAIAVLEKILEKNTNYLAAYYQLGKAYEQAAQPQQAIVTYKRGMEIAKAQQNQKTVKELNEALMFVEEE